VAGHAPGPPYWGSSDLHDGVPPAANCRVVFTELLLQFVSWSCP
jgi:hypothetical protein